MLEFALTEDLTPSSNMPSSGTDTLWVHLLPDLEPAHAVWFGPPDPAVAELLSGARQVTIMEGLDGGGGRRGERRRGDVGRQLAATVLDPPADLVLLSPPAAVSLARSDVLPPWFLDNVAESATVCLLSATRRTGQALRRREVVRLTALVGGGPLTRLAVAPGRADGSTGGLVVPTSRAVATPRWRLRARRGAALVVQRLSRLIRRGPSRATRAHPSDITLHRPVADGRRTISTPNVTILRRAAAGSDVPDYLVRIAARSGVALEGRWAVAPPRGYRSQKVIFALSGVGDPQPEFIAKMTQAPRFNHRLDNERRALEQLTSVPVADERSVPRLAFTDTHAGLLVVGETALTGVPFRARSTATADCPLAHAAVNWLTELAVQTAQRNGTDRTLRPLHDLAERYIQSFDPAPVTRHRLKAHLEQLEVEPHALPTVFSHGDPGTWNLLAGDDGGICFLDWENAEPTGVPAWDLLLFFKTYAGFVVEASGVRWSTERVLELLSRPGPFNAFVQQRFSEYAVRLELDRGLLPPLLLLCWVHQSLKEATRLPPTRQDRNGSRALVERCLAEPELLSAMVGH